VVPASRPALGSLQATKSSARSPRAASNQMREPLQLAAGKVRAMCETFPLDEA
jgi:hypothetical protein